MLYKLFGVASVGTKPVSGHLFNATMAIQRLSDES
jgi:hypothetical protein